ncbi:MAG: MFS transporter [Oscillatoriales cyanobacterium SM2_2_1]|nr:MFS transporter [Oscillatoriales cyanobacterium SM2_2_1]
MTHLFDPPTASSVETDAVETVLANRNFLSLWSGQVFSQIADKIFLVLIIAIVSHRFQIEGQPISGWVSSVMVSFTIPAILFGSVAGVYIDRWSKKWVLVGTNLLRGGMVLMIPLLLGLVPGAEPAFWGLLGITFLVSTFTQFFTPAEQSVIPLIVEKNQLLAANSLYTTTIMGALILGFALGEPMLAIAEKILPDWGQEVLVGGCYLLAGAVLLSLRTQEAINLRPMEPPHVWQDLREGLRYIQQQPNLQAALWNLISTFSIIAAMTVLAVRLAEVMPEIRSEQFGFLLADASIGMAIGAVLVARFGDRLSRRRLALIGSMGMAGFMVLLGFCTARFWFGLSAIAGVGVFAGLCVIPMQTVMQEETAEEVRGKVFGLQNNAVNIALSLPLAVAGVAESYFGLEAVIWGLGAIALLTGMIAWSLTRSPMNS